MPCSVDDCTDDVVARSFCDKHWKRWRKYGDPLAGGATPTDPTLPRECRACGEVEPAENFRLTYTGKAKRSRRHVCKLCQRLSRYGISRAEYERLLDEQGGGCAICGGPGDQRWGILVVDHDAVTGRVRGLLCGMCNVSIGGLRHDVALLGAAIRYLEHPGENSFRDQAA